MIVHFIASTSKITDDIGIFRRIASYVQEYGHSLAYDWLHGANNPQDALSLQKAHEAAISKCDILIADVSRNGFELGYQVSLAVSQKKSILLLYGPNLADTAFLNGFGSSYIRREQYTPDSLRAVVKSFLDENDIPAKDMRFNFFIDRQIYQYLRSTSLHTGKTKAEILRELVLREIDNK
ncbi:MAG: hypothetical protein JWN01_1288 [Patescibacteria group bacterium]|nr:hypothetical protein [Patescibacteria group bacterium]